MYLGEFSFGLASSSESLGSSPPGNALASVRPPPKLRKPLNCTGLSWLNAFAGKGRNIKKDNPIRVSRFEPELDLVIELV